MSKLKTTTQNLNLKSNNLRIRAYQFSLSILSLVKELPNTKVYWVVVDQLLRAATSIGANIIEAKSSSSKRDFINFLVLVLSFEL